MSPGRAGQHLHSFKLGNLGLGLLLAAKQALDRVCCVCQLLPEPDDLACIAMLLEACIK